MAALFQSVSTRTAGMNTIDLAACGPITKLLMSVLQFIGAAPGSTGGGGVTTYPITVKSAKNGDVTASHKSAAKGTTITLTVDPNKGYVLDTLTVLDGKDKDLKLTEKNGKFTFTMPASKVTVATTIKASTPTRKNPYIAEPAGSY